MLAKGIRRLVLLRLRRMPMTPKAVRWAASLPDGIRAKLTEWNLLDARAALAALPLSEHIEAFKVSMQARERNARYIANTMTHVERVCRDCGFARFADIDPVAVEAWLAKRRVGASEGKRGTSARTMNAVIQSLHSFGAWMVKAKRSRYNPIDGVERYAVERDRRHRRRALSVADFRALVTVTETQPVRQRMTGRERATLYLLAARTGLRASELGSLTRDSFRLEGEASVTVAASYAKNGKTATLPLADGELVDRLRAHFRTRIGNVRAFIINPHKTADMLRADLAAAGIPYEVDGRVFDFHALRVQFASDLNRAGVSMGARQALLRHSTITLTMDTYTDVPTTERREAVKALSALAG